MPGAPSIPQYHNANQTSCSNIQPSTSGLRVQCEGVVDGYRLASVLGGMIKVRRTRIHSTWCLTELSVQITSFKFESQSKLPTLGQQIFSCNLTQKAILLIRGQMQEPLFYTFLLAALTLQSIHDYQVMLHRNADFIRLHYLKHSP